MGQTISFRLAQKLKYFLTNVANLSVADLRRATPTPPPPHCPKFSQFHAVFFLENLAQSYVGDPCTSYGESWIRPCLCREKKEEKKPMKGNALRKLGGRGITLYFVKNCHKLDQIEELLVGREGWGGV